jgi:glycosyltransferase involved in cell wall biosynthesis
VKPNGLPDPGEPAPPGEGFLYAARLSPEKGLGLLLDAWRRHPDGSLGRLRIAGDGELRGLAEEAAAARDDIEYLGALSREEMAAVRRDCAVAVVVPTWQDVLPTVVLEAMAAGRPVLGTAVGGIPYLLGGVAGWTVAPEPAALAEALPVARAEAKAVSETARQRYVSAFQPDLLIRRLIDVYTDLSGTSHLGHR